MIAHAHEKAYICRRDHWWKPLGFLILSIYWFNPVLWVAYILMCWDIETACDEEVIRDMDRNARRAYSTVLLNCSDESFMMRPVYAVFTVDKNTEKWQEY